MKPARLLAAGCAVIAVVAMLAVGTRVRITGGPIPSRIADGDFWQMIVEFSEPDGYFRSDNLISNERAFQYVIPALRTQAPAQRGAYLGVGPDQNFTYIVALQPAIAFIVDIRRQNMLLHLMYKAVIELSADRAEFLSRLFSRSPPSRVDPSSGAAALFEAYATAPPSDELFERNMRDIVDRLVAHHGFGLTLRDVKTIEYVYRAFYEGGPDIRYSFPRGYGGRWFPSYAELMLEADANGDHHSYLATEANFQILRDLETRNLIVPLVGDFSGDKALRSVGGYLKDHGATVTAFYTSNVEQYLFQGEGWKLFFTNVASLPIDEHSTFIRAYFNMGSRSLALAPAPDARSATLLDPIQDVLRGVNDGRIQSYYDLAARSHE